MPQMKGEWLEAERPRVEFGRSKRVAPAGDVFGRQFKCVDDLARDGMEFSMGATEPRFGIHVLDCCIFNLAARAGPSIRAAVVQSKALSYSECTDHLGGITMLRIHKIIHLLDLIRADLTGETVNG